MTRWLPPTAGQLKACLLFPTSTACFNSPPPADGGNRLLHRLQQHVGRVLGVQVGQVVQEQRKAAAGGRRVGGIQWKRGIRCSNSVCSGMSRSTAAKTGQIQAHQQIVHPRCSRRT